MVNIKYHNNNNNSINSDGSSPKIQRLITSSSQETKDTEETTLASVNSDEKQRLTPTQITIEDDGDKYSIPLADEPKSYRDWFKYYGPSNNGNHKQLQYNSHRRDRLIVTIILVGALLTLVIFIAFMYERVQRKSDQNQREVNYLSNKLDIMNRELQQLEAGTSPEARARKAGPLKSSDLIKKMMNDKKILIKLVGDGGVEKSQSGKPIHNWAQLLKKGNITLFNGRVVKIQVEGYYLLQARMYFKNNMDHESNHLDFGIVKRSLREREYFLLATTVPKKNCQVACGSYISEIVHLRKGDMLSIQTKDAGQRFGMYKDRASFALYKF